MKGDEAAFRLQPGPRDAPVVGSSRIRARVATLGVLGTAFALACSSLHARYIYPYLSNESVILVASFLVQANASLSRRLLRRERSRAVVGGRLQAFVGHGFFTRPKRRL